MNMTRPGQPAPTPRPGTGPQILPEQPLPSEHDKQQAQADEDTHLHPQEISREEMESKVPADPDPDDPVSP